MTGRVQRFYKFGPYLVNKEEKLLMRGGEEAPVKPKVFDTLLMLIENQGRLVSKEELMQALWPDSFVDESSLTQSISLLRKTLGKQAGGGDYVETLPKRGYRFAANVEVSVLDYERSPGGAWDVPGTGGHDADAGRVAAVAEGAAANQQLPSPGTRLRLRRPPVPTPAGRQRRYDMLAGLGRAVLGAVRSLMSPGGASGKEEDGHLRFIAVLPFKELGREASEQALGLAMADSLIYRLNRLGAITTLPTSSVAKFSGNEHDAKVVGERLGVKAVLDGTVQHSDSRVRVTVTLLNVAHGWTLWSGRFDERYTDIFALQDSIADKVSRALELRLAPGAASRPPKGFTRNVEAYRLYSIGLLHWNKRSPEGLLRALDLFRAAAEKDPGFALAFAAICDVHILINFYRYDIVPRGEGRERAEGAARKALSLDPTLPEAYAALGAVRVRFDQRYGEGELLYRRALELGPNLGVAHLRYGYLLLMLGRLDEALQQFHRALELDPLSPSVLTNVSACHLYKREPDEAIKYAKLALEIDPNFYRARDNHGMAYVLKGMYGEARAEFEMMTKQEGTHVYGRERLAFLYAVMGRRDAARELLDALERDQQSRGRVQNGPSARAQVYAALGQKKQALELLEKAAETEETLLLSLRYDYDFDSLRSEPDFISLVSRLELKVGAMAQLKEGAQR